MRLHPRFRSRTATLLALIFVCVSLRLAVLTRFSGDLSDDRDTYLALAEGLRAGRGYSVPGTQQPTAYRPPLYVLLLVPLVGDGAPTGVGLLHLTLSAGTCLLLWMTAGKLGLPLVGQLIAVAIYAADPLSIRYVAFPMTETACAFLVSLLLFCLARCRDGRRRDDAALRPGDEKGGEPTTAASDGCSGWGSLLCGMAFGACVLCRPTFWLFGVMYLGAWILWRWSLGGGFRWKIAKQFLWGLVGVAVFVVPWGLRNAMVLGRPVFTTTHGGYTLLLGNNRAFYREVVDQPWGVVWDGSRGSGQEAWFEGVNAELSRLGIHSEIARDAWLGNEAISVIRQEPKTFLRACLRKFLAFWNIVPNAAAAGGVPRAALLLVEAWYILTWVLLVVGLMRIGWTAARDLPATWPWVAPVLLIMSLTIAHLVYWSDARMRAPVVPAIALVCAAAWCGPRRASANSAGSN